MELGQKEKDQELEEGKVSVSNSITFLNILSLRFSMGKKLLLFLFILLLLPIVSGEDMIAGHTCSANVEEYNENSLVMFYWYTCPHCHKEIKFIQEEVVKVYPDLEVHIFETKRAENDKNRELFASFAKKYSSSDEGVPRTFVNGKAFIGYDEGNGSLSYNDAYKANIGYRNQLIEQVEEIAERKGLQKNGAWNDEKFEMPSIIFIVLILLLVATLLIFNRRSNNPQTKRYFVSAIITVLIISFFIFVLLIPESYISGFAQTMPFWLFTFTIALADGFNPCAFTVLFILLSLLTYTKVKKTMFHIGNTFVITSAVMYFIFIMIMVLVGSLFIAKYGEMILKLLGIIILIAGTINLKDFLFFKKGVSLTLSQKETTKITHKARKIVQRLSNGATGKAFWIAMGSTILLAIGVNIVELGCSAILPAVYMSALIGKFGTSIGFPHYAWTVFYSIIYIIPLYAILFNFIFTFKSERINEKQGRILKLIAGVFMFICGIIMVLKPTLLLA